VEIGECSDVHTGRVRKKDVIDVDCLGIDIIQKLVVDALVATAVEHNTDLAYSQNATCSAVLLLV
jgi:hypothetical protein